MAVAFDKRRVYRNLVRPYQPLGEADRFNGNPHIYRRVLPGPERPRDDHYIYAIVLIEIDPEACSVPIEEKSSIHTVVTVIEGRPAILSYILLDRSAFNFDDTLQLTERLLCAAHELLYTAQYPSLVENNGGEVTADILRDGVSLVNPDEECDLVCSFITVSRFRRFVATYRGAWINSEDDLATVQASHVGQNRFRSFWEEERCISEEMAYDRIREFIERGLVQPEEDLNACRAECAANPENVCSNPTGPLAECTHCAHFADFTWRFQQLKCDTISIDQELVGFLCKHLDC